MTATFPSSRKRHRTQPWRRVIYSELDRRGLNQEQLARKIGIRNSSQVRAAIRYGFYPSTIRAIEAYLGITPSARHIPRHKKA